MFWNKPKKKRTFSDPRAPATKPKTSSADPPLNSNPLGALRMQLKGVCCGRGKRRRFQ